MTTPPASGSAAHPTASGTSVAAPRPGRLLSQLRTLVSLRQLCWPVLAGTLTLLAALSLTVVSAWLITRSWQMPPLLDITVAVTAVRALGISRAAFRYIDRLAAHRVALSAAEQSRVWLWRTLAKSRSVAARTRGDLAGLLGTDIDALADVVVRALIPALIAALTSLIAVGFTAILSPEAAGLLALGLFIAGAVVPVLSYRATVASVAPRAHALTTTAGAVEAVLQDSAGLRINGRLDQAIAAASGATEAVATIDRRTGSATARASALATASSALTAVATVALGAFLLNQQSHSAEWLAVLVLIPLAAFESVAVLPGAAQTLARSRLSIAALAAGSSLPDAPAAATEGTSTSELTPKLRVRDLVVGYPGRPVELGAWSCELPFGHYLEITAPSGSGKTTLLRTLAGHLDPLSGSVELREGEQLLPLIPSTIRFIAEDEHVFATTVRDNIAVGNPLVTEGHLAELLDALGLRSWVDRLPQGLDTVLADGADSLSGGQRRRLILARALASTAPVLLLDEPTEHLDDAAEAIVELLRTGSHDGVLPGVRPRRSIIVVHHPR